VFVWWDPKNEKGGAAAFLGGRLGGTGEAAFGTTDFFGTIPKNDNHGVGAFVFGPGAGTGALATAAVFFSVGPNTENVPDASFFGTVFFRACRAAFCSVSFGAGAPNR